MKELLAKIGTGNHLSRDESKQAMEEIMEGRVTDSLIASLLMGLKVKGEHPEELLGFAEVMRARAIRVRIEDEDAIDMCGTGGDGRSSFNISTVASFVVAGAGVTVAKHGNRSVSSLCGSADLLAGMGANVDPGTDRVVEIINNVGIGFLFAPQFHPAMKHAAKARADLGVRTLFNLLGPLSNPASVQRQVVGAFSDHAAEMLADVFSSLGATRIAVVHSASGFDEVMLDGTTTVREVNAGGASLRYEVHASSFGLETTPVDACAGGSVGDNVRIALEILNGEASPGRNVVIANAALGLYVAGKVATLPDGTELAKESIDSGRAMAKLRTFIHESNA